MIQINSEHSGNYTVHIQEYKRRPTSMIEGDQQNVRTYISMTKRQTLIQHHISNNTGILFMLSTTNSLRKKSFHVANPPS